MNKSDVIDLMAEVGLKAPVRGGFVFLSWEQLAALVQQAKKAEREACEKVKVTKAIPKRYKEVFQHVFEDGVKFGKAELRKAIRARSKA